MQAGGGVAGTAGGSGEVTLCWLRNVDGRAAPSHVHPSGRTHANRLCVYMCGMREHGGRGGGYDVVMSRGYATRLDGDTPQAYTIAVSIRLETLSPESQRGTTQTTCEGLLLRGRAGLSMNHSW